jgi:hypothetical protein
MLSVALTFYKVLLLGLRFIWYVLGLSLTLRLIESCLLVPGPSSNHKPQLEFLELSLLLGALILGAATNAALLGILREPDRAGWNLISTSVSTYTWVLLRLGILITLIASAAALPFALIMRWLQGTGLVGFAFAFVYLVLIKYALAYPIAVNEQLNARQALKRSWEMTRGHYRYAAFCYLLMASAHVTVNQLFESPWLDAHVAYSFSFFIKHAIGCIFDSVWIVLGWQMYLDIKDADEAQAGTSIEARAQRVT